MQVRESVPAGCWCITIKVYIGMCSTLVPLLRVLHVQVVRVLVTSMSFIASMIVPNGIFDPLFKEIVR